jgi:integrase
VLTLPVKRRGQYMVWDTGTLAQRGLGVLVSPSGTKSYRVVFYYPAIPGEPHSMHLGRVGDIKLAKARELAREARSKANEGFDPKANDLNRSDDFKSAVEDYVKHWQIGKRGNATAHECRRILLKACADWHQRPVDAIRVKEIDGLICAIRDGDETTKPKPYLSNKVYGYLRAFFGWCVKPQVGKLKTSPMIGLDKPFDGEKPRERVFNDDEIKALWLAANKIGGVEGRFLKALLLTGKRKGALARMKWEHINANWFWQPPKSESTKNKKLLPAPLSTQTQLVLGPRQPAGYVFPGPVDGTHYNDDPGMLSRKVRRESGVADFFPHALRHTCETKLADLRAAPHVRDLLFDHQPQRGSGAGYDHHEYGDEMREAIERWSDYVAALVQPKLVAEIPG